MPSVGHVCDLHLGQVFFFFLKQAPSVLSQVVDLISLTCAHAFQADAPAFAKMSLVKLA